MPSQELVQVNTGVEDDIIELLYHSTAAEMQSLRLYLGQCSQRAYISDNIE
jgi:hypothetical protein